MAIDQSQLACNLTMDNARTHKFDNRIQVIRHKLSDESSLEEIENGLDLIVSNPPYVPNKDLPELAPEIKLQVLLQLNHAVSFLTFSNLLGTKIFEH